MTPLAQLLALATIAGQIAACFQVTAAIPLEICADDRCQNCVAVPPIPESKFQWPSCSAYSVTDVAGDQTDFGEVISG